MQEPQMFVVNFISFGAGIDIETQAKFDAFLETKYPNLNVERVHWGREGEVNYCINLDRLSEMQRSDFVRESTEILGRSSLVKISEKPCCR